MFFFLFAAVTLYLAWLQERSAGSDKFVGLALASLAILFISVLLHALGHCFASYRLGTSADRIVLWPLGELAPVKMPRDPRVEMAVHFAGPLVNLVVCMVCMAPLLAQGNVRLLGLMHPLNPDSLADGGSTWLALLKLTFWINWLLLLVNLIPAFPFDAGRALRTGLAQLWPAWGRRHAGIVVTGVAKTVAVGLLLVAWFVRDSDTHGLTPVWFALLLLAIFLFFSAKQEQDRRPEEPEEDELFGYDFSQGYTSLEQGYETTRLQPELGPIAQWLRQRRQARQQRRRERELDEERRVDEILARLHEAGMDSLSQEDRAVLDRVSARYRNRQGHGA
jgi:Zn-dependent protease